MKVRPIILCGGEGTRLWDNKKNIKPKQFINFGSWTLFDQTLKRVKNPLFDYPIISTNRSYEKKIRNILKKNNFKKYKIVLEPEKKNTAPAILSAVFANILSDKNKFKNSINWNEPLIFLSSDHYIEKKEIFVNTIKKHIKYLTDKNIFLFGVKPNMPSSEYGYILMKKNKNIFKAKKFLEKPNLNLSKKIIEKGGYWNSGMFLLNTMSVINNYKKYSPKIYNILNDTFLNYKSKTKVINKKIYVIDNKLFKNITSVSFDYSILEKAEDINIIKLNIPWSDLGSWKEILNIFYKKRNTYISNKNVFFRPWGKYTNLFKGENFLIKEIYVKSKAKLSLQKHFHRSEHWIIKKGSAYITLNNKIIKKKIDESIFIPKGSIHRVENKSNKPLIIYEAQIGKILKESDIVRYDDIYGRVKSVF